MRLLNICLRSHLFFLFAWSGNIKQPRECQCLSWFHCELYRILPVPLTLKITIFKIKSKQTRVFCPNIPHYLLKLVNIKLYDHIPVVLWPSGTGALQFCHYYSMLKQLNGSQTIYYCTSHPKHKGCKPVPTAFNESKISKPEPAPNTCLKLQLLTVVDLCTCFGICAQLGAQELIPN